MIPVKYDSQRYPYPQEGKGPEWDSRERIIARARRTTISEVNTYVTSALNANQDPIPAHFRGIKLYDSIFAQISTRNTFQRMTRDFPDLYLDRRQILSHVIIDNRTGTETEEDYAKFDLFVENGVLQYDLYIMARVYAPSSRKWNSMKDNSLDELQRVRNIVFEKRADIGNNFNNCRMKKIIFKNTAEIGGSAFILNPSLKSVKFLMASSIGASAFSDCEKLENIYFQESSTIGQGAFFRCPSLKRILIPDKYALSSSDWTTIMELQKKGVEFFQVPTIRPSGNLTVLRLRL